MGKLSGYLLMRRLGSGVSLVLYTEFDTIHLKTTIDHLYSPYELQTYVIQLTTTLDTR